MTVPASTPRWDYLGNDATSVFPYTQRILDKSHLKVRVEDLASPPTITTLIEGANYTVSGIKEPAGGNITLVANGASWLVAGTANLKNNYKLAIQRVLPLSQDTDLRNQGVYFAETHEDQFDREVMTLQQLKEEVDRCVRLVDTEAGVAATTKLPPAAQRASKLLGFDASGNLVVSPTVATVPGVGGSGTIHKIPKFTAGSMIGDSVITVDAQNKTLIYQPVASDSGVPTIFMIIGPSHVNLQASGEIQDVAILLNRTVHRNTGNVALQRAIRIEPPTYSFVAASVITEAATVWINGPPVAGSNCTITKSYGLVVQSRAQIAGIELVGAGGLALGSISPLQLTSDKHDYDFNGNYQTFQRLSSDAARNITGFAYASPGGGNLDGRLLIIANVGGFDIVLKNQNVGSAAANRIITGTGADVTLAPDDVAILIYDGTTQRWRLMNAH